MDNYSLKIFLHLSESLHFGKTSSSCHITPSGLSRLIKRLEEEVGEPLFFRDNRSVSLTPAGRHFQRYALETLNRWEDLRRTLSSESESIRGEVSLYGSVTACYSVLPEVLEQFGRHYPDVRINLKTGAADLAIKEVINGTTQLGVAANPENLPANILFKEILTTPLVFIIPGFDTHFSHIFSRSAPDFSSAPLILSKEGLARKRVDQWFRDKGFGQNINAQVSGNEAILAMVGLGLGFGVVPKLVVEKSPFQTKVQILEVDPPLKDYSVGICCLQKALNDKPVRAFWETIDILNMEGHRD